MTPILGWIIFVVWLYVLWVTRRSELPAWHFIWGSCGLFVLMMIFLRPYCTQPLAQVVAALAGGFGKLTGMFQSYFKYGVIFVNSRAGAISLLIDFECSGILEIMAFVALLAFLAWNWMFGTVAMPKKSAPVFPQGRIFSRLFPLILPHKLEQLLGFSF